MKAQEMIDVGLRRYALSCVAVALLAGCGGSQPPIGALGAMPQTHMVRRVASSTDLIYASGGCGGTCVASYPEGNLLQSLNVGEGVLQH
jgi:hypothetical protein